MFRVKSRKKLILLLILVFLLFGAVVAYMFRGDLIYFLGGEEAYNAYYGLDAPMPPEFYEMFFNDSFDFDAVRDKAMLDNVRTQHEFESYKAYMNAKDSLKINKARMETPRFSDFETYKVYMNAKDTLKISK
jgi:hypothetical protein